MLIRNILPFFAFSFAEEIGIKNRKVLTSLFALIFYLWDVGSDTPSLMLHL